MFGCDLMIGVIALVLAAIALRKLGELRAGLADARSEIANLRDLVSRGAAPRDALAVHPAEPAGAAAGKPEPAEVAAEKPGPAAPAPAPGPAAPATAPGPAAPATAPFRIPEWPPMAPDAPLSPVERRGPRLEERIAARLPVWIGSIALFLAGAFLVKYSFDRGLLGPAARVTLGLLFGVALVGGGEFARRRAERIAQGLSAAGIAVLYAALLAGTSLYQLISRPVGFGLLALTTAAAVLLSLRHGPLIAVLGLVGGFVTPALIGSVEPNAAGLFTYLLLLELGLLAAARPRRWWPLAALTILGGTLWVALWLILYFRPGDELPLGLFLTASLGALVAASRLRGGEQAAWGDAARGRGLVLGGGLAVVGLLALLAGRGSFGTTEWIFLGLVGAGCLLLARLDHAYEPLAWAAGAAGLVVLMAWDATVDPTPAALGVAALLYGALVVLGAYAALWGAANPARWAVLSAAAAVLYFLAAWAFLDKEPRIGWGALSLIFAVLAVALAFPLARRRDLLGDGPLAALAVAATVFVSAAVPFELGRYTLTVAWALEVAALAWIESRLRVPLLRRLAGVLGVLVLARLLLNPFLLDYPAGDLPLFNWVLYGYGVPALAFALAAWLWRRAGTSWWDDAAEFGAVALTVALLALQVRHWFHAVGAAALESGRVTWMDARFEVAEWGAIVVLWLLFGLALLRAARSWPRRSLEWSGRGVGLGALALGLGVLGAGWNPLFESLQVGSTPFFNAILFAYGGPALLALVIARELAARGEVAPPRAAGVASLLFFLGLIVLEVRQAFHGTILAGGETTSAELYTYSAALMLFATVLLVLAIVTRGVVLRWASLAVTLLAVAKVFLYDMSALRDLYRVFAFLGLGVSLLVIAYLYQRFVFRTAR